MTVADCELEHSVQMIRVDAYRLATIVQGYSSCARAYYTRLLLDPNADAERSHTRQKSMKRALSNALERLVAVRRLRDTNTGTWEDVQRR